jgi:hypothetical protein
MHTIDPLRIKWHHNNHEISNSHLIKSTSAHQNQATLILYIHHLSLNDSGLFKCVYDNGKASKDVRIFYTSSSKYKDSFCLILWIRVLYLSVCFLFDIRGL